MNGLEQDNSRADSLILQAAAFSQRAHAGQRRKFGGSPYVEHPARVAARVMLLEGTTPQAVAAAWLHDVLEDCGLRAADLRQAGFPDETVFLVVELTNPSKQRPELSRAERKALDREHLRHVSRMAQRIKLVDRIDNLRELGNADARFKSLYVAESVLLVRCIRSADTELAEELERVIESLGFSRDHEHARAHPSSASSGTVDSVRGPS